MRHRCSPLGASTAAASTDPNTGDRGRVAAWIPKARLPATKPGSSLDTCPLRGSGPRCSDSKALPSIAIGAPWPSREPCVAIVEPSLSYSAADQRRVPLHLCPATACAGPAARRHRCHGRPGRPSIRGYAPNRQGCRRGLRFPPLYSAEQAFAEIEHRMRHTQRRTAEETSDNSYGRLPPDECANRLSGAGYASVKNRRHGTDPPTAFTATARGGRLRGKVTEIDATSEPPSLRWLLTLSFGSDQRCNAGTQRLRPGPGREATTVRLLSWAKKDRRPTKGDCTTAGLGSSPRPPTCRRQDHYQNLADISASRRDKPTGLSRRSWWTSFLVDQLVQHPAAVPTQTSAIRMAVPTQQPGSTPDYEMRRSRSARKSGAIGSASTTHGAATPGRAPFPSKLMQAAYANSAGTFSALWLSIHSAPVLMPPSGKR